MFLPDQIVHIMIAIALITAIALYVSVGLFALWLLQERGFRKARESREFWGQRFTLMGIQHRQQMAEWRRESRESQERWEVDFREHRKQVLEHRREFRQTIGELKQLNKDNHVLIQMILERLEPPREGTS